MYFLPRRVKISARICSLRFYTFPHYLCDICSISSWRHQMETFSASLALCAGNSPLPGEFLSQRPVTRSFDVFFDLCLHKRLSKQSWSCWFATPSWTIWRHGNGFKDFLRAQNVYHPLAKYRIFHRYAHGFVVLWSYHKFLWVHEIHLTISDMIASLALVKTIIFLVSMGD